MSMKTAFDTLLAVLALAGLGFLGWYAAYAGETSAERLEARLAAKAEYALLELGAGWATVEVDGQRARLTGEAPTADARAQAESAVRGAARLELPLLPEDFGVEGGWLHGGIIAVDNAAPVARPVTPYQITAMKTDDGGVWIEGHVPDDAARMSVVEAAERSFPGQVAVQLELGAGVPGPEWVGTFNGLLPLLAQDGVTGAFLTDRRVSVQALPALKPASGDEGGVEDEAGGEAIVTPEIVLPGLPDGYSGAVTYISDDGDGSEAGADESGAEED